MANNEENLIPLSERTKSEQREIARQGGINSGKTRRQKRSMKDTMSILLDMAVKKGDIPDIEKIQSVAELNNLNMDVNTAICIKQALKAVKDGDTRAAEFCRDTSGNKPVERVQVAEVSQEVIDEVEKAVLDDE